MLSRGFSSGSLGLRKSSDILASLRNLLFSSPKSQKKKSSNKIIQTSTEEKTGPLAAHWGRLGFSGAGSGDGLGYAGKVPGPVSYCGVIRNSTWHLLKDEKKAEKGLC